ncbi:MAG: methyl-accepting chemotaxis protein [Pseudomonadota bacterium]
MRSTAPVKAREVTLADGESIVSTTDMKGMISYVNGSCARISGFGESELVGRPHSMVRHPDMPGAAFADLWQALANGQPWTGLLKNRCKNGDFYWVKANITPIRNAGRAVGFMSVGVKPSEQEVAAAEQGYRAIREQQARRPRIEAGRLVYPGLRALLEKLHLDSLAMRIWLATSAVNTLLFALGVRTVMNSLHEASLLNYALTAAIFAGLLINVLLWHTLRVSMLRPLAQAITGARAIAAGDLSGRFDIGSSNEMGQLMRALQQMNANLQATIGDVRSNVDTMASATRQIAAGNQDLSGRTEAQASSLQQTASSMDQFASSVKENAENSERANALAEAASHVAREGGVIVGDMIATMGDINDSAKQIVDIIGLIEGIAFQTNILALNAAVEAARAGEQGRGFAVVAGEVRSLAQRSSVAAKEIKQLIDLSVGKVNTGMAQVQRAGATMKQVVESVAQVTHIMGEISLASREQTLGIDQVNHAVAHMDHVTHQNAALVEEAAAAANSLHHEASSLTRAVSVFHLGARFAPPGVSAARSLTLVRGRSALPVRAAA